MEGEGKGGRGLANCGWGAFRVNNGGGDGRQKVQARRSTLWLALDRLVPVFQNPALHRVLVPLVSRTLIASPRRIREVNLDVQVTPDHQDSSSFQED